MLPYSCPHCDSQGHAGSVFVRNGTYTRRSDSVTVQRYLCTSCRHSCSAQSFHAWFRQKKRLKNAALRSHFASGGSLRRAARTFHLNRKTVARKLVALGFDAEAKLNEMNRKLPKARAMDFDDMETIEHTKLKPLSITLAVVAPERRILGLEVSSMPAKGLLAGKSREKYGARHDGRAEAREKLFSKIAGLVAEDALIKSDANPHYPADVKRHFPKAKHRIHRSRRGRSDGQGELKQGGFDPLWSLNHTCASFRANVNRLFRKTWNTTKRADRLYAHLMIYAQYHNEHLKA